MRPIDPSIGAADSIPKTSKVRILHPHHMLKRTLSCGAEGQSPPTSGKHCKTSCTRRPTTSRWPGALNWRAAWCPDQGRTHHWEVL